MADQDDRPSGVTPDGAAVGGRPATSVRVDPLDPDLVALLAGITAAPAPTSLAERRAAFAESVLAMRRPGQVDDVSREDVRVGADGPTIAVYRPTGRPAPLPLVLYFHGGGWMLGSVDTHDLHTRRMSREVGAVVCSVDYRLAPEHPYPAALEDARSALAWAVQHATSLGSSARWIGVAGDSAGANIAAALASDSASRADVIAQLLVYGAYDLRRIVADESAAEQPGADESSPTLTASQIREFASQYIGPAGSPEDPGASPLLRPGLDAAAAIVVSAAHDVLAGDSVAYAERLGAAGIDVTHLENPALSHGFCLYADLVPAASAAVGQMFDEFRLVLERSRPT